MASLAGKVITLTGGASGIGLATAKILASRGAFLAIADLRQAELKTAVEEIKESARGKVTAEVVDVRDRAAVRAFLESTLKEFGQIDGCANIAGVLGESMGVRKIWELESSEYDFVMDVNARGLFNCLAEELRPGLLKEGASIVNAASIMSKRAPGAASPYVASKHAVEGLTKAAAVDAGERGIRVNCFAPSASPPPFPLTLHSYLFCFFGAALERERTVALDRWLTWKLQRKYRHTDAPGRIAKDLRRHKLAQAKNTHLALRRA